MLDTIQASETYSAPHAAPYPLTISRGKGIYVFDDQGNRYIDMVSGISATNFGHTHPRLVTALIEQAKQIAIVPRLFHNRPLSQLLEAACQLCNMDKAIPMNSGAEAVETAIKLVRKWAYTVKKIAKDQAEMIVCDNGFHGRTITTVSLSSVEKYKKDFGPLTPGFHSIPFNDIAALEQTISENTAAFLVEPIQGEAGIILPDADYLQTCQKICKQHNVLLIVDEIQTGMGRTGKFLASEHYGIQPDGVLLGKSLGGGLLPISLFLAKDALMNVIQPGEHGSTFGGNPLACRVADEALQLLQDEKLCQQATELGNYFIKKLNALNHHAIKSVRGKGLLIAIEINTNVIAAKTVFEKLLDNGLLTINTRHYAIRLLPPLIISKKQIDQAVEIIDQVLVG